MLTRSWFNRPRIFGEARKGSPVEATRCSSISPCPSDGQEWIFANREHPSFRGPIWTDAQGTVVPDTERHDQSSPIFRLGVIVGTRREVVRQPIGRGRGVRAVRAVRAVRGVRRHHRRGMGIGTVVSLRARSVRSFGLTQDIPPSQPRRTRGESGFHRCDEKMVQPFKCQTSATECIKFFHPDPSMQFS